MNREFIAQDPALKVMESFETSLATALPQFHRKEAAVYNRVPLCTTGNALTPASHARQRGRAYALPRRLTSFGRCYAVRLVQPLKFLLFSSSGWIGKFTSEPYDVVL